MSYETWHADVIDYLQRRDEVAAAAVARQPWAHLRPWCPFDRNGEHVTVKLPADLDPDPGLRIITAGCLCLTCGTAFGGSQGLMTFEGVS